MSQRKFAVMGDNLFTIVNKVCGNQRICRMLKYQVRDPFKVTKKTPDIDGTKLLGEQINIVPKLPDDKNQLCSFITILFDRYILAPNNPQFKFATLRFDIACPYEEWLIDASAPRPHLIMQELDEMFNGAQLSGLGQMQFTDLESLVLTPQLGGYTIRYVVYEFN